jgi:hypothetical protein
VLASRRWRSTGLIGYSIGIRMASSSSTCMASTRNAHPWIPAGHCSDSLRRLGFRPSASQRRRTRAALYRSVLADRGSWWYSTMPAMWSRCVRCCRDRGAATPWSPAATS